ncbi:YkoF family thiamine/hydroxymethylpyrimidine-binding protein [Propioniciclava coleopterorum]|nr:YkoF family thiamine/hydroxymethylpyrimidine-binding protein [Propioniciclava coleopterorum]
MTPTAPPSAEPAALREDPLRFGVGARVTVAVMSDRYAEVILGALGDLDASGLVVETGDVSTYVGGPEDALLRWVTDLAAAVAETGEHASVSVHLSRGCPGEARCSAPGGAGPRPVAPPAGRRTGRFAAAEWALYPLADIAVGDHAPDHMRDIEAAIDLARGNGTFQGSSHFVTRLTGDLGDVLATAFAGWTMVGRTVQHVTSHLTVSVNSPSHARVDA